MSRRRNYEPQGSIYLPPSKGLTIANGLVQGVNSAIQSINTMRYRSQMLQIQRAQAQAMMGYRQAQAQALQNRYGPMQTTIGKLQAIGEMVKGGQISPDIGNKMITKGYNDLYDMADTPDKVNFIRQSMGGVGGHGSNPSGPWSPNAQPTQPQRPMNPSDQPVTLNYGEQKMIGQAFGAQGRIAQSQVQGNNQLNVAKERGKAAFAAQQEATNRAIQVAQAHGASAQAVARIHADGEVQKAKIMGQFGLEKADVTGGYNVTASTNRGATAAAIRAKSGATPGADKASLQAQKQVMDQIKGLQTSYSDADKPNNLGITPLPDEVSQRRQMLQEQMKQKQQEYVKAGGKDLWGISQPAGQPGASPGGSQSPTSQPKVFDYGNHANAQTGDLIKFQNGEMHQVIGPNKVDPNPYKAPDAQSSAPQADAPASQPQVAPSLPPQLQAIFSGQNSSSMAPESAPVSSSMPGQ